MEAELEDLEKNKEESIDMFFQKLILCEKLVPEI
jgi:hypothetical protein